MRAVDTNVLVRLLVRDDAAQVEAAEKFIARGAWVSCLVLAETFWVLSSVFSLPRERLAAAIEMLQEHESLTLQDVDVVAAALADYRATNGVDFSDCLLVQIARKAGHLPVGSFDRQLARLDGVERVS